MTTEAQEMREYIWARQYAAHPGETYSQGLTRVAKAVAKNDGDMFDYFELMHSNRFLPGGRVLAGAGSSHGNLLNCYVQDSKSPDPTERTLDIATKLALVTAVGGGNGVNLDYLPARPQEQPPVFTGRLFLTDSRATNDNGGMAALRAGTFRDNVTGEEKAHGYRYAKVITYETAQELAGTAAYPLVEDSLQGIFAAAAVMVRSLLAGRDVVVDLSRLRPEGAPISGAGGTSSGPVSFAVKVFDNFAYWASLGGGDSAGPVATLRYVFAPTLAVVRQGGVRRGAGMATLGAEHPDILDFITAKDLERERVEGDISTFNISVLVSDDFMRRADSSGSDEEEILSEIAQRAWATGEPGVLFFDAINDNNPLEGLRGPIVATNPCGEIPLYPGEPCDLGAINLAAHVSDGEFDWRALEATTRLAVRFLDDVLDSHVSPLPEIADAIRIRRRIGLGVMGLADALILLGLTYGYAEARGTIRGLMRVLTGWAIDESERLAEERGVPEDVRAAGLKRRNIAIMTVAPTGTTSMLAGVSSGIEPVFAASYTRRVGAETKTVTHPLVNYPSFVTAHDVNPWQHVMMQAVVQSAFDYTHKGDRTYAGNSISKTINLPHNATPQDVAHAISLAWGWGCKGITVYRDGSRDLQVLTEAPIVGGSMSDEPDYPEDSGLADLDLDDPDVLAGRLGITREELDQADPAEVEDAKAELLIQADIERSDVAFGRTHKFDVAGRKVYVTVNRNRKGQLVEVFIIVGRPSDQERTAADIIGRLISLNLKHGTPVEDIVTHLSGHQDKTGGVSPGNGIFGSIWEAVAKAIQTEAGVQLTKDQAKRFCPKCSSPLVYEEGCAKCYHCGWSACS